MIKSEAGKNAGIPSDERAEAVSQGEGRPCSDCQQFHISQVALYPKGVEVIAIADFDDVEVGTLGKVSGHCDDGRAFIVFDGDSSTSHTFHFPDDYVARTYRRIPEREA